MPGEIPAYLILRKSKTKKMEDKLTLKQRKEILSEYIELLVKNGYDIKPVMGKPLSYYNYDALKRVIKDLQEELDNS